MSEVYFTDYCLHFIILLSGILIDIIQTLKLTKYG